MQLCTAPAAVADLINRVWIKPPSAARLGAIDCFVPEEHVGCRSALQVPGGGGGILAAPWADPERLFKGGGECTCSTVPPTLGPILTGALGLSVIGFSSELLSTQWPSLWREGDSGPPGRLSVCQGETLLSGAASSFAGPQRGILFPRPGWGSASLLGPQCCVCVWGGSLFSHSEKGGFPGGQVPVPHTKGFPGAREGNAFSCTSSSQHILNLPRIQFWEKSQDESVQWLGATVSECRYFDLDGRSKIGCSYF